MIDITIYRMRIGCHVAGKYASKQAKYNSKGFTFSDLTHNRQDKDIYNEGFFIILYYYNMICMILCICQSLIMYTTFKDTFART